MGSHGNSAPIKNPGSLPICPRRNLILLVLIALGVAAFGSGVVAHAGRAWTSFVLNYFFFMSLAIGGLFFAAIQYVTNAMWSAPVRRIAEAFSAYLPIALGLFILLSVFGLHHVYEWTHADEVAKDPILLGKASYLNEKFFIVRNVVALVIWIVLGRVMVRHSLTQDATGDFRHTLKNRVLAPIFLIIFAFSFTMASFDLMMSLDPHWFSTIFGVYCFAGLFYSVLALICIITIVLRRKGLLLGIVNEEHLHDLGKFMFAFTVFWAYIGFSQFMLIWYANLPEETGYFIKRMQGPWLYVSVFLLVGKFLVPFFALISRGAKRQESRLLGVGIFMLAAQWIDLLWIVQPNFHSGPVVGWIEIGTTFGFAGLFGLAVTRFLSAHNIVAIGDPRLAESVHHHHT